MTGRLPHRFGVPANQDNPTAERRGYLTPLTSLRFFAALGVVLFHMAGRWGMPAPKSLPFGVGVELFFVLSGFILAYNYRSIAGLGHALKIIGYRVARIWPLHIVTLMAVFVLLPDPTSPFKDISKAWASALLIQSWFGNHVYAFNGNSVSWTLSVELAFYLVFPFLTMLSSRMIVVVTTVVTAATIGWAYACWGPVKLTDNVTSGRAIMLQHPGAFLVLFAAGMLAGRAFLGRDWNNISRQAASGLELLTAALCVFYFLYNAQMINALTWRLGLSPALLWLKTLFGAIFFLPLIFMLAIGRGRLSAIMRNPVLAFLGDISFATYMCHTILLGLMAKSALDGSTTIVAYLAAVYATSAVLYFAVERPGQRLQRKLIDTVGAGALRIWSRCRGRLLV